jgi:phosphoribosylanthranilate isomerase
MNAVEPSGWIKICGLTSAEAVDAALAAGADAIGFVCAESVRRVAPSRAAELAAPALGRAQCVAVTRHPDLALLQEIDAEWAPDLWQSDAADHAAAGLVSQLPHARRLPVLRAGQAWPEPLPELLLFEGPVSGTGRVGDWDEAARLAQRTRVVLAGGLNASNVAAAIRRVCPWGVDVSSGVEEAPGVKSPRKINEFVRAARAAFEELQS